VPVGEELLTIFSLVEASAKASAFRRKLDPPLRDGCEQHLGGRDAEREAQSAVAIIRIDPIPARAQRHRRRHLHGSCPAR